MTAHRYCRRSIAAGTDSPLRIHSLDSLADSGLRRSGAAPSVPVALSSVPPSGERHSRIHRAVAAVGVSLRSVSFSSHIGCTVNFVGLPWTSRLREERHKRGRGTGALPELEFILNEERRRMRQAGGVSRRGGGVLQFLEVEGASAAAAVLEEEDVGRGCGGSIMVWEKEKSTFKYLLCGILRLHSMCDLASRVPKIEQISEEQLIDLVFYLLVLLGAYIQVNIHFLIRYCSLQLLTVIVSSQYQEVALALTAYYKVAIQDLVYICKEAAFAAVCVDVKYLRTNDSSRSVSPTTEETLNHLGCSVILLFNFYSLCVSKSYFGNALLTNRFF
ncbi:hypothetical protein SASPL_135607 [Salvia splendens]|uniref:Nodulin homeobox N-terminal domain-containing protein n=1 Tax=Salvia splendens TaxID=180675 RepID=A0A8X8VXG9_SALSN|nr:hypothetical protein SASPL_156169 [Salvia splendens]KAG6403389.1 hypothetical protein SASPL_135607 [Salvia splendens]